MDIRDRIKELRRVPANELKPNPRNWRTHPKAQLDAIRGVLGEIGFAGAELARELPDGTLELIDGHARAQVAGEAVIPVLVLDVDQAEADKLLATFDPIGAMAGADKDQLDALLRSVSTNNDALNQMMQDLAKDSGLDLTGPPVSIIEDDVPDPPAVPVTQPGDLWILGDHRLLCGDSTKADDVGRLMGSARASIVFTDPPYGVSAGAKNRMLNTFQKAGRCLTDIVDDDLSPEELEQRLLPAFVNCRTIVMAEDCTLFVCSPQGGELSMMMMMMQKAGLKARHVLIWKKNQPTFSMGRLDYDYQHEPILLTWVKRHKRPMQGSHKTSIWEIDKPRKSADHPTMKPVALYANAFLNNSDHGDIAYEPYAGSGTAVVAAEQLSRRCYGMEISPQYCDVIVRRWQNLTGRTAVCENRPDAVVA
jgi:DNA modification methylase